MTDGPLVLIQYPAALVRLAVRNAREARRHAADFEETLRGLALAFPRKPRRLRDHVNLIGDRAARTLERRRR